MTSRPWFAFLLGILTAALVSIGGIAIWRAHKVTKIHTLAAPLLVAAQDTISKNLHLLPKGATLYFDKAYPEGFSRYKLYINVDRMPLPLEDLADPAEIRPVDAYAPSPVDLRKLLKDYPLTKDELVSILKSTKMEKEEIRSILADYSR
jgi:hypothetical protein